MRYDKIKECKFEFEAVLDRYDKPAYIVKHFEYNHFPSVFEIQVMFPDLIDGTLDEKERFKVLKRYGLSELETFAVMYANTNTEIVMCVFHTKNKKTKKTVYKLDYSSVVSTEIAEIFQSYFKDFVKLYNKNCLKTKHRLKDEQNKKTEWKENESFVVEV